MASFGSPVVVNPGVYLNYLSPDLADEYEFTRNLILVALGALIWDIFSSTPDDYWLIRRRKLSVVLSAYVIARPAALALAILSVLQKTGPVWDCGRLTMIMAAFQVISAAASSYLFLKRAHAVYSGNRTVQYTFSILWLVAFGTSCVVFSGPLRNYVEIANTGHCIRTKGSKAISIAFMDPILFDTLVYFSIMYKILSSHRNGEFYGWRALCSWRAVPHFSQAVLRGGQQYYLITTGVNIARLVLSTQPSLSPTMQVILSSPATSLTSVMACRVHRNLMRKAWEEETDVDMTLPTFAERRTTSADLPTTIALVSWDTRSDSRVGSVGTNVPKGEIDLSNAHEIA